MKDELVKAGDFNVVVVDWAGGSLPLYTQATANTRLVGLEVAHFIKTLQVCFENVHFQFVYPNRYYILNNYDVLIAERTWIRSSNCPHYRTFFRSPYSWLCW